MTGSVILTLNGKTVGMKLPLSFFALGAILTSPVAVSAEASADMSVGFENISSQRGTFNSGKELPPYLQCVPYAREMSGIQIYGDAHSWWDQADGRYQRGRQPQVGAVMAFQPYQNMKLGHVAAVSKVIDSRTVLISHSNWSPINGRRGQIERNVRAIDVSPNNDWSMVRVWYDPLQAVGKTAWPVHGFIYSGKAKGGSPSGNRLASLTRPFVATPKPSKKFSQAFANLAAPAKVRPKQPPARVAIAGPRRSDPVLDAIARYEK
jgi:surface antigen